MTVMKNIEDYKEHLRQTWNGMELILPRPCEWKLEKGLSLGQQRTGCGRLINSLEGAIFCPFCGGQIIVNEKKESKDE